MQFSTRTTSTGLVFTVLTAAWMSGCGAADTPGEPLSGDDSGAPAAPSTASSPEAELSSSAATADRLRRRHPPDAGTGTVDAGAPACVPTTCSALGATCGAISDGCSGTLSCGQCPSPETCGGGGVANACGSATPPPPPDAGGSSSGGNLFTTLPYRGLAMGGAEFGASYGGQFNGPNLGSIPGDYYYPTSDLSQGGPSWPAASNGTEIETGLMVPYYLSKGMNTIRLPLRWERLQRSLSSTSGGVLTAAQVVATFQPAELAALENSVNTLTAAGYTVLVDIHNYATYTSASEIASNQGGDYVGSGNVPNVAFENLWIGLASIWANNPKVVFDIMNEPNTPTDPAGQPAGYEWYLAAQAAVTGIRSIGANNLVLICGNNFADASEFQAGRWSDPLKNIKDPANNFAFEIHDYPDTAFGTADSCTTGSGGTATSAVNVLSTFLAWAKQYNVKGFLGEFSAGISTSAQSSCISAVTQMLTFLGQNSANFIGWTYWAGGAGFGSGNPMNSEFFNPGNDSPQMTALAPYLK